MRVLFDAIEQSFEINDIYGVISDLYAGSSSDFILCHTCGFRSEKSSTFYDLQLPVNNEFENVQNDSVEKAMFENSKTTLLTGDNAYFCERCDKKVDASKGTKMDKLPKILTL
jgi:ubiquitin C-terminal hydrolase